ncbi:ACP S-malonyltransferase [Cardinium endosymbiont of Tipula unca]|uniref:ACP S-malonyltransferase n=1 Tax=Cardinium endosymbiont of Tipula unca TaxID=3066216 RepID=UPI0030CAA8C3
MKAYLFPGQGSQQKGMGKELYCSSAQARQMFETANQVLDMDIIQVMLEGSEETLRETTIAQPAIFLHSVTMAAVATDFCPSAVAGHSLGEISALVASKSICFEDGLRLVAMRSKAMKQACQLAPGTMAAVIGLSDEVVQETCRCIMEEVVVPANYNCAGQLVISGSSAGVAIATEALVKVGARKVIPLRVEGGFHSPLMDHAKADFALVLASIPFAQPICPIYQNVTGLPTNDPQTIKDNLLKQLVSPIYWTATIEHMVEDGITQFIECGPGAVLQGLVRKIAPCVSVCNALFIV